MTKAKTRLDYIKDYYAKHNKLVHLAIPGHPIANGQIRVGEYEYSGIKFNRNVAKDVPVAEAHRLAEAFDYMVIVEPGEKEDEELWKVLYSRVSKAE
ncbi:hypothetical protein ACL5YN_21665 [Bacillus pacificus]|uniref:hypothetical protein n=1 Tax=Bacillus pacificus TaxID=2026187 RepID=UPI001E38F22E|nr:hypothetical protein [Bacillus pacificus]UEP95061.1 hypothetical protein LMD38_01260 [Bacillus pacificus]HDR7897467.1 hypothetical protein [Bacillus pacificus]